MAIQTPHFRQPFAFGSYVEQGTPDHILSCQYTIAACPTGFRDERPEFGWDFPTFQTMPVDFDPLVDALKTFEPRDQDVTVAQAESIYGEVATVTSVTGSTDVNQ